jgi:hypothetical protein
MGLTLRKPENYLTSLTSAWNFNSVQHVCVNLNVSIHKCFKTHRLAQFQTPTSKRKLIKHSFPSTRFSFAPLSDIKWNTADGSKDHSATNKATGLFSIKTTLFTFWYHTLNCRNVWLNDVRFLHQKSQIELCVFYCHHPEKWIHRWMLCIIIEHYQ